MPFLRAALLKKKAEPEPEQDYVLLSPLVEEQPEPEEEFEPTRIEELHRLMDIRTEEAEREELGTEAETIPEYDVITVEVTPLIEEEVPEFEPEPEVDIIDAEITELEAEPEPIIDEVEPEPQEESLPEPELLTEPEIEPEVLAEPEPEPEEELPPEPESSAEEIAEPEEELSSESEASSEEIAEPETENDTEEFTGIDEIVPVPEDNGGNLDVLEVQEEESLEPEAGIEGAVEETAEETQPEEEPEPIAEEITEQKETSLPETETSAEEITGQEDASLPEAETVTEEITEPETEPADEETAELEPETPPEDDIIPENDNEADFDENALMDDDDSQETETESEPEPEPEPKPQKDYSGSQLNYDFTSGERYVDKVSTKTEFDKMLDELSAISKDLLSWEAEKFAKKYTDKFEDGDSPVADARKFEAFLGGYITNAAMLLYDLGYKDAAIKQLEQAISILQARKKLEDETSAIKSRVEEQNDAVDLSDILGLFGDG